MASDTWERMRLRRWSDGVGRYKPVEGACEWDYIEPPTRPMMIIEDADDGSLEQVQLLRRDSDGGGRGSDEHQREVSMGKRASLPQRLMAWFASQSAASKASTQSSGTSGGAIRLD